MSTNMFDFQKYSIFKEIDQQLINRIKLFFIACQNLVFFITSNDEVFMYKVNDGLKKIDELCNKCIIKIDSNSESCHSMALTDNGTVYSWGYTTFGECGHNTTRRLDQPKLINSIVQYYAIDVSLGYRHTLILTNDGEVLACGYNAYGQCGNNSYKNQLIPINVKLLNTKVVAISCGYNHSIALTDNGLVYVWGNNEDSQLGINSGIKKQPIPTHLPMPKIKQISCGTTFTCLLSNDGDIYIFGKIVKGILYKKSKQLNTNEKFIDISASIRCHFFVGLSENQKCFVIGKYFNDNTKEFKETEHSKLEDVFPIDEQITFKTIKINNSVNDNECDSQKIENNDMFTDTSSNDTTDYGLNNRYNNENRMVSVNKIRSESVKEDNVIEKLGMLSQLKIDSETEIFVTQSEYNKGFTEIRCIARGGYSNVFIARDNKDNNMYAIKKVTFESDKKETVMKELDFLLKLESDFVVKYYKSWIEMNYYTNSNESEYSQNVSSGSILFTPHRPYILHIQMELCPLSLRDAINKLKDCLIDESTLTLIGYYIANELMYEIFECVAYLHSQTPSIIHRDLKPENILITNFVNNRFVKLTDFGLSKFHEKADQSHTKNVGTDYYRAPDVKNNSRYTTKADIYSLGIIMKELFIFDFDRYHSKDYKEINYHLKSFNNDLYTLNMDLLSHVPLLRPNCKDILVKNDKRFFYKAVMLEEEEVKKIINGSRVYKIEESFVEFFLCCKLK